MVLDSEDGQLLVLQALHGTVVEVDMGYLQLIAQRGGVGGISVVLGGDVHGAGGQLMHRVIAAAVPELELEMLPPESLMN